MTEERPLPPDPPADGVATIGATGPGTEGAAAAPETHARPAGSDGSPGVRITLWTVLGLALVAAVGAGLWNHFPPEPPPPLEVIGEAPRFTLTDSTGAA